MAGCNQVVIYTYLSIINLPDSVGQGLDVSLQTIWANMRTSLFCVKIALRCFIKQIHAFEP